MKSHSKILISTVLSITLASSLLAGCGGESAETKTAPAETVAEAGTAKEGTSAEATTDKNSSSEKTETTTEESSGTKLTDPATTTDQSAPADKQTETSEVAAETENDPSKPRTASAPAKSSTSATAKPASQPTSSKPAASTTKPAAQPASQTSAATTQSAAEQTSHPYDLATQRAQVLAATNAARRNAGVQELIEDANLDAYAQTRAKELAVKYSHTRPNGLHDGDGLNLPDGLVYCSENIASCWTDGTSIVNDGWMKSDGHRKNMLTSTFTHIGIGYYNGYWVQEFAQPGQTQSQANTNNMSRDDYFMWLLTEGGCVTSEEANAKCIEKYGY